MELELVNNLWQCLAEYFNVQFCFMVLCGTEILKLFLTKSDGKWHFKFDKHKYLLFNIRIPIVLISLVSGAIIVIFGDDNQILFSLFATLCITIATYDFIIETIKKKINK